MKRLRQQNTPTFDGSDVIDFEQAREERREKRRRRLEKRNRPEPDAVTKKRLAKRRRFAVISTAVLLFLAAVITSAGINLWTLHKERQETSSQLEALQQKQAELENELLQLEDAEYIEQKARSELHMIFPGETMYVVSPVESDEAGEPAEAGEGDPVEKEGAEDES